MELFAYFAFVIGWHYVLFYFGYQHGKLRSNKGKVLQFDNKKRKKFRK